MTHVDPNLTLDEAKDYVGEQINAFRNLWLTDHFSFMGHRWDCDDNSRFNIIGVIVLALMNGGNLPDGFIFRDYDNNNVPMTGQAMCGLGVQMFTFVSAVYQFSWVLKSNLYALTTVADVNAFVYDEAAGWPSKDS